ncbi:hypothetical protein [Helicobacter cynogastricus]|uniref:hypothetical protein n=1 Tax=Helicobacter cynogastricus TaxID=329937 RepID=UPI000CF072E4|nr:hypothetical protein [Helicobacter cynogastricus]
MIFKRYFLVPVLWMLGMVSSLLGIDVHALSKEEAKSAALVGSLVVISNKILEDAIDNGRDYREVKKLDNLYQKIKDIRSVVAPNKTPPGPKKKEGFEVAFKKALERPVDLDRALDLVDALQKELKDPKWGTDLSPLLALLDQLQSSLHTALDLKAQWLNTRKAN